MKINRVLQYLMFFFVLYSLSLFNANASDATLTISPNRLKQQVKFGADLQLTIKKVADKKPEQIQAVMDRFKEMGMDMVRVPIFPTRDINNEKDSIYNAVYKVSDIAEDNGLTLFASLANGGGDPIHSLQNENKFAPKFICNGCESNVYSLNLTKYAKYLDTFVAKMAEKDAKVSYLGPFNEDPADPNDYRKIWSQMSQKGFQRVGGERQKLEDSIHVTPALLGQLDIMGSHFYDDISTPPEKQDSRWAALTTAAGDKPVWFTEAARYQGSANEMSNTRSGLEQMFTAIRGGAKRVFIQNTVNNLIWYNGGKRDFRFSATKLFTTNTTGHVIESSSDNTAIKTVSFLNNGKLKINITNGADEASVATINLQGGFAVLGKGTRALWTIDYKFGTSNAITFAPTTSCWTITVPANAYMQLTVPVQASQASSSSSCGHIASAQDSELPDFDKDGTADFFDTDDDGDGFLDVNDDLPLNPSEHLDTDGDGIGNHADTDDDGDGIEDSQDPNPLEASTESIINDTEWFDTQGNEIFSNKGPKITRFGDKFYWVGVKHNSVKDLYVYSSKTFGSNSWKQESVQDLKADLGIKGIRQTHLIQNPNTGKYMIYGKAATENSGELIILESDSPIGPFKVARILPCEQDRFRPHYEFGDMSLYVEGKDVYMVVSRHHLTIGKTRRTAIYKLTPDGKSLEKEVYWEQGWERSEYGGYESHYINKVGDQYVMTMSLTAGWTPSWARYTTAPSLAGPWHSPIKIPMNPVDHPHSKISFESQHRWIKKIGTQWVYYGDRFPKQKGYDKYAYDPKKGSRIMLPVTWDTTGEHPIPTIHWQKVWSIDYDGDGHGNHSDLDDDNDKILDDDDAFPLDASEWADSDQDGVGDNRDAFPSDPKESLDSDRDGIGNNSDSDDDGDQVLDENDLFPLDASEWADSDKDGVGDNSDAFPYDASRSEKVADDASYARTDTITNNVIWRDTDGHEILVNKGGHVTQIGDTYYWVGVPEKVTGTLYIYSSKTLASDSWKLESTQILPPSTVSKPISARNATMLKNPLTGKYIIVGKANGEHGHLVFFQADIVTGPYHLVNTITPEDPKEKTFHPGYEFGGMSVFQEGDKAYLTVSRRNLSVGGDRYRAIYQLDKSYTSLESEISWEFVLGREAPWIFKKDDLYYMTMSGTKGWDPTPTYYYTAEKLSGPWVERQWVKSSPFTKNSYNTQQRWIMKIGEQWMWSGDRYVETRPELYPAEQGRVIMLPVTWDNSVIPAKPVLNWKDKWSIDFDGDGQGNDIDDDDDNDGIKDSEDDFPLNASESLDTDGDGIGDNTDRDDDSDGIEDSLDAFPKNTRESVDTDRDGIGNNADIDDDADGIADNKDRFPLDTDNDGIKNSDDPDDDNDGVPDSDDSSPLDVVIKGSVIEDKQTQYGSSLVIGNGKSIRAQTKTQGRYGWFSISEAGDWQYRLNNELDAVQALAKDKTLTDHFQVQSSDGVSSQAVTLTIQGNNDAPEAVDDVLAIAEDSSEQAIPVLTNDRDIDGDKLILLSTESTSGRVVIKENELFFIPLHNFTGSVTVNYCISDGAANDCAVVTVTVTNLNDAPEAVDDVLTIAEDSSEQAIQVLNNDRDVDGDSLTLASAQSDSGKVKIKGSELLFTPQQDFTGFITIKYCISDGVERDCAVVKVTVEASNSPPIARDDVAVTYVNKTVLIDSLSNDSDTDSQLQITDVDVQQGAGIVTSTNDGKLRFIPAPNFIGGVKLAYTVSDGELSASAMIDIMVLPEPSIGVNQPPNANKDNYTLTQWKPVLLDVLANDSDAENSTLKLIGVSADVGVATLVDNKIQFIPIQGELGHTLLQYIVIDEQGKTAKGYVDIFFDIEESEPWPKLNVPVERCGQRAVLATGRYTHVELGTAEARDRFGNRLPVSLLNSSPRLLSGTHLVYWQATDADGRTTVTSQKVCVEPLISLNKSQLVKEGEPVRVSVYLNGEAVSYPMTIPYTVSVSADGSDHHLTAGSVEIQAGTEAEIELTTVLDGSAKAGESIVITLDPSLNRGSQRSQEITIQENSLSPQFALTVSQAGKLQTMVTHHDGPVTITADIAIPHKGDELEWLPQANELAAIGVQVDHYDSSNPSHLKAEHYYSFDPSHLKAGLYQVGLKVIRQGAQPSSVFHTAHIQILEQQQVLNGTHDSDGDNVPDNLDGLVDRDQDGIPDYQDSSRVCNIITEASNQQQSYLIESSPGSCLRRGDIALGSQTGGAFISGDDVTEHANGINNDTGAVNVGGIFDFIAYGLTDNTSSISVVLPQRKPIPAKAVYRKYTPEKKWVDFKEDEHNSLWSAQGEPGYCPPPNSEQWQSGLNQGHWCVQLKIEDGGDNDDDGQKNGEVVDPGYVGVPSTISSGNHIPTAQDHHLTLPMNSDETLIPLSALLHDPDGDSLSVTAASANFGHVAIEGDQLKYQPLSGYGGDDVIRYAVSDGHGGSALAEITISFLANQAPRHSLMRPIEVNQGESSPVISVLDHVTDKENDTVELIEVRVTHGKANFKADGQLVYTPNSDFSGEETVYYRVQDSYGNESESRFTVKVLPHSVTETQTKRSGGSFGHWSLVIFMLLLFRRQQRARQRAHAA